MLAQDSFHDEAQLRAGALAGGPVDGHVAANRLDQLAGDGAELVVAEDLDGALVLREGVVERDLVVGQPEILAAPSGFPDLL